MKGTENRQSGAEGKSQSSFWTKAIQAFHLKNCERQYNAEKSGGSVESQEIGYDTVNKTKDEKRHIA